MVVVEVEVVVEVGVEVGVEVEVVVEVGVEVGVEVVVEVEVEVVVVVVVVVVVGVGVEVGVEVVVRVKVKTGITIDTMTYQAQQGSSSWKSANAISYKQSLTTGWVGWWKWVRTVSPWRKPPGSWTQDGCMSSCRKERLREWKSSRWELSAVSGWPGFPGPTRY